MFRAGSEAKKRAAKELFTKQEKRRIELLARLDAKAKSDPNGIWSEMAESLRNSTPSVDRS